MVRALVKTNAGKIYEDADHSIGVVGSAGQLSTFGSHVIGDFGVAASAHWWELNTNGNDNGPNTAINFTTNGGLTFNGVGFFGREALAVFDGVAGYLSASNALFNFNPGTGTITFGGWFLISDNRIGNSAVTEDYIGFGDGTNQAILRCTAGTLQFFTNNPGAVTTNLATYLPGGWHHFAVSISGGVAKCYIDGQLAGTSTSIASGALTSSAMFVGRHVSASSEFFKGLAQGIFFTAGEAFSASAINLEYSKRFKGGAQLAGGHILAAESFPFTSASGKVSFWNMTGLTDASGNGNTLTNNGAIPFTGLNISGVADCPQVVGTTKSLQASGTFFEALNATALTMGGWFSMNAWNAAQNLMTVNRPGGGDDFNLSMSGTSLILETRVGPTITVPISLTNGSWHHVAGVFDGSQIRLYLDGVLVGSLATTSVTTFSTSVLHIGARGVSGSPVNGMSGRFDEVFFARAAFTDQDILKLASTRIDLSVTQSVVDQNWIASYISEDGQTTNEMPDSFLVDKKTTKVWLYFGPGGSGHRVNLRMNQT